MEKTKERNDLKWNVGGYRFNIVKENNGYYNMQPLNFTTQAAIVADTRNNCLNEATKYIKRVLHYNQ